MWLTISQIMSKNFISKSCIFLLISHAFSAVLFRARVERVDGARADAGGVERADDHAVLACGQGNGLETLLVEPVTSGDVVLDELAVHADLDLVIRPAAEVVGAAGGDIQQSLVN